MTNKDKKDFLVALLKNESDLDIVLEDHWYRIPVATKRVPKMVKEGYIKYISFYHNRFFKNAPSMIRYFAEVTSITRMKKNELFPWLKNDVRGEKEYFVLHLGDIRNLENPIVSLRKRRILFITTTLRQFKKAREINDLFIESYLEEKLWAKFRQELIEAERQYYINISEKSYLLDFALFCRERNIDIECDGDEYHLIPESVKQDKARDNNLESKGWSVLRYDHNDITKNPEKVIKQIKESVNHYGGLESTGKPFKYIYFDRDKGVIAID